VEDIRKGLACLCCLIFLGPILFIIGITILLSSPFSTGREDALKQMNLDIASWTTSFEPQVSQLDWTVNGNVPLPSTSPSFQSELPDNTGVNSYTPWYFTITSSSFIAPAYYNISNIYTIHYNVNNTIAGGAMQLQYSFPLFWTNSTSVSYNNSQVGCINKGGWFQFGTCYFYNQLVAACLKVDNSSGYWSPNLDYGGVGCQYIGSQGTFSAGVYQQVNYNYGQLFQNPLPFNAFQVTVRHVKDPYIEAQYITRGTMNFGLTKAEIAAIGLGIMIVGIVFMIPCCAFGAILVCAFSRRNGYSRY